MQDGLQAMALAMHVHWGHDAACILPILLSVLLTLCQCGRVWTQAEGCHWMATKAYEQLQQNKATPVGPSSMP